MVLFFKKNGLMKVDAKPTLNLSGTSFTIEFWGRRNNPYGSGNDGIQLFLTHGNQHGTNQFLHLGFRGKNGPPSHFSFDFYGNALNTESPYGDTDWHHWACLWDREKKIRQIYRDGELVGSGPNQTDFAGQGPLFLGGSMVAEEQRHYDVSIDDIRVWNRARTGPEIRASMNHRLVGRENGLLAYWRPDRISSTRIRDETNNLHDGLLTTNENRAASGAEIGANPGVIHDSFAIKGRQVGSGLSAVFYHQQETSPTGHSLNEKPLRGAARVMLTVATKALTPANQDPPKNQLAVLDFAVARTGALSLIPDPVKLVELHPPQGQPGNAQVDLDSLRHLEDEIKALIACLEVLDGLGNRPDTPAMIAQKTKELAQKRRQLATVRVELDKLEGQVRRPMPTLHLDPRGLASHGGLLKFAVTDDDPELATTASGRISLYFRGSQDQFSVAYFNTNAARIHHRLPTQNFGQVTLAARATGTHLDKASIFIEGEDPNFCTVTVTNPEPIPGSPLKEEWRHVPREPTVFADVLSGRANQKAFVATVEPPKPKGDVTELKTERVTRALIKGSILTVSGIKLRVSADVALGATAIPIEPEPVTFAEPTPAFRIPYDYDQSRSEPSNHLLTEGSLLFHADAQDGRGPVKNGSWTGSPLQGVAPEWVADTPGTCVDLGPTTGSLCTSRSGLHFPDSNHYLNCGDRIDLRGTSFTIEFWARFSPGVVSMALGQARAEGERKQQNLHVGTREDGRLVLGFYACDLETENPYVDGDWHHFSFVFDFQHKGGSIFCDGRLALTKPPTCTPFEFKGKGDFLIGRSHINGAMTGDLAEVRVWKGVRSPQQIHDFWDRKLKLPNPDLMGYWPFGQDDTLDRSGNGHHGVRQGSPNPCLQPVDQRPQIQDDLTMEAWIKPDAAQDVARVIHSLGDRRRFGMGIKPHGGRYRIFAGGNATYALSRDTVADSGAWSHLAAVHNPNYALDFKDSDPLTVGHAQPLDITGDLTLEAFIQMGRFNHQQGLISKGQCDDGSDQQLSYALSIDQQNRVVFAFQAGDGSNRAYCSAVGLTEERIYRIAVVREDSFEKAIRTTRLRFFIDGQPAGLGSDLQPPWEEGRYRGDRAGSNRQQLYLGSAFGDLTESEFHVPEKEVEALRYQKHLLTNHMGRGNYLHIQGNRSHDFEGIFAEARVWNRALSAQEVGRDKVTDPHGLVGHWTFSEGSGNQIGDHSGNHPSQLPDSRPPRWVDDPRGDQLTLYCNGQPVPAQPFRDPLDPREQRQFTLGALQTPHRRLQTFKGEMDEVRLWSSLRTPEEIQDNQYRRLSGREADLAAYYPFDAESSTLVLDRSDQGNHLEVFPRKEIQTQALALNKEKKQHLIAGKHMQHLDPDSFTVSFWAKLPATGNHWSGIVVMAGQGQSSYWRFVTPHQSQPRGVLMEVEIQGKPFIQDSVTWDDDQWHHVTGSFDNVTGLMRLFLDGKPNQAIEGASRPGVRSVRTLYLGRHSHGEPYGYLNGSLAEVRLWNRVLAQGEIEKDMRVERNGRELGLAGYWSCGDNFEEGGRHFVTDRTGHDNHGNFFPTTALPLAPAVHQRQASRHLHSLSTAPVGQDIPPVRSALASVHTPFQGKIESRPTMAEYGDIQTGSDGNLRGVLKRCYSFIADGRWNLVTGFKLGDLASEWVGQVQFDPQIEGYIEGAPPVPSENLTVRLEEYGQTYEEASVIEVSEAQSKVHTYSISRDSGFDTSFEGKVGAGVGFGDFASVTAGVQANLETSAGWLSDTSLGSTEETNHLIRQAVQGAWEQSGDALDPALQKRYVPNNMGLAIVRSQTADLFALRLQHRDPARTAVVAMRMRPNPHIPKDLNTIAFQLNPRYTKQGVLDGRVGFTRDKDYRGAARNELSYFKPHEAYRRKNAIRAERQNLKREYQNLATQNAAYGSLIGGTIGAVGGPIAGALAGAGLTITQGPGGMLLGALTGAAALGITGAAGGSSIGGAIGAAQLEAGMARLEHLKPWERNLVNSYLWTASGGLYSESQQVMYAREDVEGGNFSLKGMLGTYSQAEAAIIGSGTLELSGLLGGHFSHTTQKSNQSTTSFGLEVSLDVEKDITVNGKPHPGKVDAYRFMSFYLRPEQENLNEFFNKVVDPIWLQQSRDGAAALLLGMKQDTAAPPCWRVLHRVTFVSRIAGGPHAPELETKLEQLGISSTYQLTLNLAPHVRDHVDHPETFSKSVQAAVTNHLPELESHQHEILALMQAYFGVAAVAS